ncbi:hypothetical protein Q757_00775, partial [Oenococcus alcoholitolerans]
MTNFFKTSPSTKQLAFISLFLSLFIFCCLSLLVIFKCPFLISFDKNVSDFFFLRQNYLMIDLLSFFSFAGRPVLMILFISLLTVYFYCRAAISEKRFFFFILTIFSGNFVWIFIKELIKRQRPEHSFLKNSFSFPSGHSTDVFIVLFLLVILLETVNLKWKKTIILAFLLFSLVVAFSRIY